MQANAREILLLAAEDAFEFERWRDAGPTTADIDPETRAAEVAEFEALGIPLPSDLDSLRRELEHAPKVRDAIRCSALAMRRSGRASASSLVALGPQQLMHAGAGMPWGWPGGPMLDPRLAAAAAASMDPRLAARMGFPGGSASTRERDADDDDDEELRPRSRRARERTVAAAVDGEPIDAQVVEDYDDEDDDDDDDLGSFDQAESARAQKRQREAERLRKKRRADARKARAARARTWEDDDLDGDDDDGEGDSMVGVAVRRGGVDRNTWILAAVSGVAVIALLWIAFGNEDKQDPAADLAAQQLAQQQALQAAAPVAAPVAAPAPAIDPNTGLPYGQAPAPIAEVPTPAPSGRGGRGSAVRGSGGSAPAPAPVPAAAGGGTAFGGFKDVPAGPGGPQPAATPAAQPAAGGTTPPAAGGTTPPPAGGDAAAVPAPQPAAVPPAEQPKPAEPAKPEEPMLAKSKMTPAIRDAATKRAGELLACQQDAQVGKPDVAGTVVFTISLDDVGVVSKVDIAKDEVGYGVAKCAAKKIRRWTLPSAGIPIIFDLPFGFS